MRELGATTDERDTAALAVLLGSFDRDSICLQVKEQPQKGRACRDSNSIRSPKWPIEPPPVVELTVHPSADKDLLPMIINSPNYFCTAELKVLRSRQHLTDQLSGNTVSSLHKVKNNNAELGVFVFSNIHVKTEGEYQLVFNLLEMRTHDGRTYAAKVTSVESNPFVVQHHSKPLGAVKESSTFLKSLANQGVKLRLRKDATKRKRDRDDWSSNLNTATAYMGWSGSSLITPTARPPRGPAEDISTRIQQRPATDIPPFSSLQTADPFTNPPMPLPEFATLSQPVSMYSLPANSAMPYTLPMTSVHMQGQMLPPTQPNLPQTERINWGYAPPNMMTRSQPSMHYRQDSGYGTDNSQAGQIIMPTSTQEESIPMTSSHMDQFWTQGSSYYTNPITYDGH